MHSYGCGVLHVSNLQLRCWALVPEVLPSPGHTQPLNISVTASGLTHPAPCLPMVHLVLPALMIALTGVPPGQTTQSYQPQVTAFTTMFSSLPFPALYACDVALDGLSHSVCTSGHCKHARLSAMWRRHALASTPMAIGVSGRILRHPT